MLKNGPNDLRLQSRLEGQLELYSRLLRIQEACADAALEAVAAREPPARPPAHDDRDVSVLQRAPDLFGP
ncbi:hypothetical protein G7Z17_g13094 [Cylindrodendrum hubeiense]|uniref:Uncharacterized protein n=1 Tax=Cylindrodendrum hubeiense TaxID=595255 RepID=A0A9P5H1P1_9HYPO|nr:hypothetical protein G7Z17_g13094 [Cylindrodendrum hubeiense]